MLIIKTITELRQLLSHWRQAGDKIGLVPTMGYLHEGHQSLMLAAKATNQRVVVSIFVNPTQFGANEDLTSYPRDLEHDVQKCQACGVEAIFHPDVREMYPDDFKSWISVEQLGDGLCGLSRPQHFRGMATIVTKLLNIVQPDQAFFGQKDAQQLAIIRQLVADLNIPVDIVGCPIVREIDGLAKSSRNSYLTAEQRRAAPCLQQALRQAQVLIAQGEHQAIAIETQIRQQLAQEPLAKIDYIQIVDQKTLQPVTLIERPILCALAVFIGSTRLIDNFTY